MGSDLHNFDSEAGGQDEATVLGSGGSNSRNGWGFGMRRAG